MNATRVVYDISMYPKQLILRDGSRVAVRPIQRGDEESLREFFLGIPADERFFFKEDVTSPEVIAEWVEKLDYRRALPLLAWIGERVVADAVLVCRRGTSREHVSEIRIVVAPAYRGLGLGSFLIRELCDIAEGAGLQKVFFEAVEAKEQDALKAAEWAGFVRICTIEGGSRDREGRPHDVVLLELPLGKWHQWTRF